MLFFGCRDPYVDDLYHEELSELESAGVVEIKRAYSKALDHHLTKGCRYVQHRLVAETEAIQNLWAQDAIVYVCGSGSMAKEVRVALEKILGVLPEDRYIAEIF